jgi:hypothetical protein
MKRIAPLMKGIRFRQLELIDQLEERFRFVGKFSCCRACFLDHGRILLRHLVHLVNGGIHFIECVVLLPA